MFWYVFVFFLHVKHILLNAGIFCFIDGTWTNSTARPGSLLWCGLCHQVRRGLYEAAVFSGRSELCYALVLWLSSFRWHPGIVSIQHSFFDTPHSPFCNYVWENMSLECLGHVCDHTITAVIVPNRDSWICHFNPYLGNCNMQPLCNLQSCW